MSKTPKLPWKQTWPDVPEDVAIDVMPASNGEYVPKPPSRNQLHIMALQDEKIEHYRRKFNMDRRSFVRTAAAYAIGISAINTVTAGRWGSYAFAADGFPGEEADDLENPGAQLANLPGEFILDTQGHHLDSAGRWRIENPGFEQFLRMWTSQAMGQMPGVEDGELRGFGFGGELDPMENLGRYHYFKEMFLDSSTTVSLLTALPNLPDATNILPVAYAKETVDLANHLSQSERCFMHAFAQPNRGFIKDGITPIHQAEDFAWMEQAAKNMDIYGWKLYCGWGDAAFGTPPPIGQRAADERLVVRRRQRDGHRRAHPHDLRALQPAEGDLHPQGSGLQRDLRLGQVLPARHGRDRPAEPGHQVLHVPLRLRRRVHDRLPRRREGQLLEPQRGRLHQEPA